jgi:hypothetical protein
MKEKQARKKKRLCKAAESEAQHLPCTVPASRKIKKRLKNSYKGDYYYQICGG